MGADGRTRKAPRGAVRCDIVTSGIRPKPAHSAPFRVPPLRDRNDRQRKWSIAPVYRGRPMVSTFRENRKSQREQVHYPAWVETEGGKLRQCVIEDVSLGGARIILPAALELPDEFPLWLSGRRKNGRRCRTVWRDGRVLGVQFLGNLAKSEDVAGDVIPVKTLVG